MKKLLSVLLSCCMLVGSAALASAAPIERTGIEPRIHVDCPDSLDGRHFMVEVYVYGKVDGVEKLVAIEYTCGWCGYTERLDIVN